MRERAVPMEKVPTSVPKKAETPLAKGICHDEPNHYYGAFFNFGIT